LPDAVRVPLFRVAGDPAAGTGHDGRDRVPDRRPCDPLQRAGLPDPRAVRHPAALHGRLARLSVGRPPGGRPRAIDRGHARAFLPAAVLATGTVYYSRRVNLAPLRVLPGRDVAEGHQRGRLTELFDMNRSTFLSILAAVVLCWLRAWAQEPPGNSPDPARQRLRALMPMKEHVELFLRGKQGTEQLSRNSGWLFDANLGWVLCDS